MPNHPRSAADRARQLLEILEQGDLMSLSTALVETERGCAEAWADGPGEEERIELLEQIARHIDGKVRNLRNTRDVIDRVELDIQLLRHLAGWQVASTRSEKLCADRC